MKFSKILTYSGCYAIPLISYFFITSYFNSELAIQFYNYFLNKSPVSTWPSTYILGTIYLFTPTQNFQKHEQKGLMPQCVRKESKEKRKYIKTLQTNFAPLLRLLLLLLVLMLLLAKILSSSFVEWMNEHNKLFLPCCF